MIDAIASPIGIIILYAIFGSAAVASLLLRENDTAARYAGAVGAIVGSVYGIVVAVATGAAGTALSFSWRSSLVPLLSVSFHVDALASLFIGLICSIALCCSVYALVYVDHYRGKYDLGVLGFFYNIFIVAMIGVVSVDNGLLFLVGWELMSLSSFFLVIYDHDDKNNLYAGYVYLVMTHIATGFIIIALLLLYRYAGSFDFESMRRAVGCMPPHTKNIVFLLAFIGFGTKAGMVPVHVWLPGAHPAAPSHVSALMSGVMIKTGIYMMIRLFLEVLLPVPLWWGVVVLGAGALSSLLGVLYALTEHDLKRLLACHSIENIGIILLGLGSSLCFLSLGMPALSLLGLAAALFHTVNHATFKSLLFLSAGSVIMKTHTRNMEAFGGLIRQMPLTALFFLVGSMAISALPPFNGFFSEWLTFQSLFCGITEIESWTKWAFIASAGALAFTGGLALACFVKAFGTVFLARPRHKKHLNIKESPAVLQAGMAALAVASLLLGIFSGPVAGLLSQVARDLQPFQTIPVATGVFTLHSITIDGFSMVNAPLIAAGFLVAFGIVAVAVTLLVNRRRKVRIAPTWDCGTDLTPRMEINSTGFARSLVMIFRGILKPTMQRETLYHDAESRYLPKSRQITMELTDLHRLYLYKPLRSLVATMSFWMKTIQNGNINLYILYIFIALLAALTLVK